MSRLKRSAKGMPRALRDVPLRELGTIPPAVFLAVQNFWRDVGTAARKLEAIKRRHDICTRGHSCTNPVATCRDHDEPRMVIRASRYAKVKAEIRHRARMKRAA